MFVWHACSFTFLPSNHIVSEFNKGIYDIIIAADENRTLQDDTDDEEEALPLSVYFMHQWLHVQRNSARRNAIHIYSFMGGTCITHITILPFVWCWELVDAAWYMPLNPLAPFATISEPAQGQVLEVEIDGEPVDQEPGTETESGANSGAVTQKERKAEAGGKNKKKDKSKDGEYGVCVHLRKAGRVH